MYTLGIDLGSSSVKVALYALHDGKAIEVLQEPSEEMPIQAPRPGFAEQDPELWWQSLASALGRLRERQPRAYQGIQAIGIAYQMHGLVLLDQAGRIIRPGIIWCDSRAVQIGEQAFAALGEGYCQDHLGNSPGNFTASKLRWVQQHEPDLYRKVRYFCLPGDYLAWRLSGDMTTTISGLSEGVFWDFKSHQLSRPLLDHYRIDPALVPRVIPTFGKEVFVGMNVAQELHLKPGIPISYRAGDQPNNAFSLNVLEPGQVAATAGTSGVIYGVTDQLRPDPLSRINLFAHVTHQAEQPRLGALLCLNGAGILNAWARKQMGDSLTYESMNTLASTAPIGSMGLAVLPFGNGAERLLQNQQIGGQVIGLDYNRHQRAHFFRACQEGIAFAMCHGMDVMKQLGMPVDVIRAGHANLFLSPVFRQTLANCANVTIELSDSDGATGAARGAAYGAGLVHQLPDCFSSQSILAIVEPNASQQAETTVAYDHWRKNLDRMIRRT